MTSDAELIPRRVLFGNPEKAGPRISPDGGRLAYLAPVDGVLNVWVGPVDGGPFAPVTSDSDRGIRAFFWAHDGRHLLYLQDRGGDENWRLHGVDLVGGGERDLTPFEGVQAQVVAVDKEFPNELLIGLNRDNPELHDVFRLDLRSGELEKVVENPGVVGWVVDSRFTVRGAVRPRPDGGMDVLVRDEESAPWKTVLSVDAEDALTTSPVAFNASGDSLLLVSSQDFNAGRLVRLRLSDGAIEVLAEDPRYDVSDVLLHPDTREPQAAWFTRSRREVSVLDRSVAADLAALAALSPGDFAVTNRDAADRTWLVAHVADDGPVAYHLWRRDTGTATFLFHHQPDLSRYRLAGMEPFTLTARDGLEVHGYLTFPPGGQRLDLPAVLVVHGGPWARDTWGLHPEAQWLANRGYLCVQVNFRGSTGYGKGFVNAGDREWAGKMHDDLVDAVGEVCRLGYADPDRIGIYGGSYGGYAALVGATFTPELFRCAVDVVGPSNLKTLIESIPAYWAPLVAQFHRRVGDPAKEEELLWSRSPLSRVDAIRIPILVAQGANDPRVKQAEAEQIVAAMVDKGIDHEYLLFPDEGHGFAKPDNRLRFYAAAEQFLARHLGGRYEP